MKLWTILAAMLILGLACGTAFAAPSVKFSSNRFVISEAVNDEILAQVKAEMGKADPKKLSFYIMKITNDDLAKLCAAYPGIYSLRIEDSDALTSIAPVAGLKELREMVLRNGGDRNKVADLSPLAGLTEMLVLELYGHEMGPDLKWMSGMSKLTKISISSRKLTSLEGIPSLPQIKHISIEFATPADLSPLLALPALESLSLTACVLADLSPLAKLPELTSLNLAETTLKDFSPLAASPKLKKIRYYLIKDPDFSTLGKLTQLEEIDGGSKTLADISWVANLQNLKKYDMFKEPIEDYSPLAKTKVEELRIWDNNKPVNLNQFAGITTLTKLRLQDLDKTTGFEGLGSLVNLKTLNIEKVNSKGGTVDLAFLSAGLPALDDLVISDCTITNFDAVAKCEKLRRVELRKVSGVTSLAALKQMPALRYVVVSKGAFPEAELTGFGKDVKVDQR